MRAGCSRWGLIALVVAGVVVPGAGAAPLGHSGRWITDADGRVVVLHGVNMVYKRPPYTPQAAGFDAPDADFLARQGFNTVRLGIIYKGLEPEPGRYDDAYLDRIGETVEMLAKRGIFTLLDFHQDLFNERYGGEGFPDWAALDDGLPAQPNLGFCCNYQLMPALSRAFDSFWSNRAGPGGVGLQDRYAAAWRHVADRLGGRDGVLGYDLLNEPWPGSAWPTCANNVGCPDFEHNKLGPFSKRMLTAIRGVDRKTMVFYEPEVLFNFGPQTHHPDLGDPETAFSFHDYCLVQGAYATYFPESDPLAGVECDAFEDLNLGNAEAQSHKTGDALLMSEFGATNDLGYLRRIVGKANSRRLSWQYWHYCECEDPTTSGTGVQSIVPDAHQPPEGSNLRTGKLDVLAEPYPQITAGTPHHFTWNADSRTFRYELSTAKIGGGRFGAGAVSQIAVPPRAFPDGYRVIAGDAQVISAPGSGTLRLAACPVAATVSVRLEAANGSGDSFTRCLPSRLRLSARPARLHGGHARTIRFRVTTVERESTRPVAAARIAFAGRTARTGRDGRARLRVRLRRHGTRRAQATRSGYEPASAHIRVLR